MGAASAHSCAIVSQTIQGTNTSEQTEGFDSGEARAQCVLIYMGDTIVSLSCSKCMCSNAEARREDGQEILN